MAGTLQKQHGGWGSTGAPSAGGWSAAVSPGGSSVGGGSGDCQRLRGGDANGLQRAFADREGEPLNVRVGLNAGEPIEEDGDLFGATVILASRIAADGSVEPITAR
ncbi:MAG: hypothetical protein WD904_01855 [Dehalococcoidia bacterium]